MIRYAILVSPEADGAHLHHTAYKTLAEAQNAIRDEYGAPEAKSDYVYKGKDYTYYYIHFLEVKE